MLGSGRLLALRRSWGLNTALPARAFVHSYSTTSQITVLNLGLCPGLQRAAKSTKTLLRRNRRNRRNRKLSKQSSWLPAGARSRKVVEKEINKEASKHTSERFASIGSPTPGSISSGSKTPTSPIASWGRKGSSAVSSSASTVSRESATSRLSKCRGETGLQARSNQ